LLNFVTLEKHPPLTNVQLKYLFWYVEMLNARYYLSVLVARGKLSRQLSVRRHSRCGTSVCWRISPQVAESFPLPDEVRSATSPMACRPPLGTRTKYRPIL